MRKYAIQILLNEFGKIREETIQVRKQGVPFDDHSSHKPQQLSQPLLC